ncbi:hypothetical protein SO078_25870 (plasmid) [Sinorhizobium meliloti]|uniref:hypothetical protein n=1 Tax=Rhizobium meliloti TaxID=382 RepID=UPI002D79298F|nr:hypothetical protein [Sinorhizobium meliloti]WRQ71576.1 hypothetical protein SO078_25870 [Sinorhizobium meliloti]
MIAALAPCYMGGRLKPQRLALVLHGLSGHSKPTFSSSEIVNLDRLGNHAADIDAAGIGGNPFLLALKPLAFSKQST